MLLLSSQYTSLDFLEPKALVSAKPNRLPYATGPSGALVIVMAIFSEPNKESDTR